MTFKKSIFVIVPHAMMPLTSVLFLMIFITDIAYGADYSASGKDIVYVRDGGSGNGTSWSDALDNLPATLVRDNVYMVADGSYGEYTFNDNTSGTDYIYIVKATEDDHGTDTGWSSTYGDGQAIWSQWELDASYLILDGQEGGGPSSWKSGHGFKLYDANCPASTSCSSKKRHIEIVDVAVEYIDMSHIEIEGCGTRRVSNGYEVRDEHFYAIRANNHVTISYVWAYNTAGLHGLWLYPSYLTIEYSYFENQRYQAGGTCSIHGESWNFRSAGADANTHIRWNVFKNFYGTAGIAFQDSVQGGYEIYGNVFYFDQFDGEYEAHTGTIFAGTEAHSNMLVHNNTFVDLQSPGLQSSTINIYGGTGNYARNNLWVNAENAGLINNITGSNNTTNGNSELFLDYNNDDFRLSQATDDGYYLPAPYNLDMYGNVRGQDGTWDQGAFEYDESPEIFPIHTGFYVTGGAIR